MKLEEANKNYKKGSNFMKASFFNCRFHADFTSAIPYLKLAADDFHSCGEYEKEIEAREKLVKCFIKEKSSWEEGNEYEKISKVQLDNLKSPSESYKSIKNSFNAYINNHSYEDALKALNKSYDNFMEKGNKEEAEKVLDLAFDGIQKYYHVIILDKDEDYSYVYECIDKYADFLSNEEKYDKCAEICQKSAELIEKENNKEKKIIAKYYAYQALEELFCKKEDKYREIIEKGMKYESGDGDLCHKINKLIILAKQNNENEQKSITSLFYGISTKLPNSIYKNLNKYIQENKGNIENINNNNNNIDDEEDMK